MAGAAIFAGRLRHLIRIETPVETPDGAGGSTTTWTSVGETRALVEPVTGRERLAAQAVNAELSHTVTIRFRAGVTPRCRVIMGSRVFQITAVIDPEEVHRSLVLSCVEVFGATP